MENEIKALAQSLALFLEPKATVSGLVKGGVLLNEIIKGFYSSAVERSAANQSGMRTAQPKISESFFYRYILSAPLNISFLGESQNITAAALADAANGRFLSSEVGYQLPTGKRFAERYRHYGDSYRDTADVKAEQHVIYSPNSDRSAAVQNVYSGWMQLDINRISEELGEQLHQKLAAGYPMYER